MGWKGTLRSINSAIKAMEREAQRRQRELARQQVAAARLAERERAAHEVAVFENRLGLLTSIHREHTRPIDWSALAELPEPQAPAPITLNQDRAQAALDRYRPSLLARVFGSEVRDRGKLKRALEEARERDRVETEAEQARFKQEYEDWVRTKELAARILRGDAQAMIDAIREMDPFSDLAELGSSVEISANESGEIGALVHVNSEEVIPRHTKSQLKSGKLSVKPMPKGKFHELYQDYVCGCVLRVANELLALLPIDAVVVTAVTPLLNSATGHLEEQAILSVYVPRASVQKLNLDLLDPSDAMVNFLHRMDFKKAKGFGPIEPLSFADLARSREGAT